MTTITPNLRDEIYERVHWLAADYHLFGYEKRPLDPTLINQCVDEIMKIIEKYDNHSKNLS